IEQCPKPATAEHSAVAAFGPRRSSGQMRDIRETDHRPVAEEVVLPKMGNTSAWRGIGDKTTGIDGHLHPGCDHQTQGETVGDDDLGFAVPPQQGIHKGIYSIRNVTT